MFQRIKDFIRRVMIKVFGINEVQKEAEVEVAVSTTMADKIDLWSRMYENEAPWLAEDNLKSMNLSADVASEVARLTTLEMHSEVTGNEYLDEQYQELLAQIRTFCEYGCASGGLAFKPYISGDNIEIDTVRAGDFYPTTYNGRNEITGAVFVEQITEGKDIYTRLEHHEFSDNQETIINKAFLRENVESDIDIDNFGKEIPLDAVEAWADLEEETLVHNLERPLFSYFKNPMANNIDPDSPVGVSVYARAEGSIEEADRQWSRIWWEFEGTELAVHASTDCFRRDEQGDWVYPEGKERLYRAFEWESKDSKAIEVFSPAIRDTSLFNGLNKILQRIEFDCGLSYGVLSDPQQVDKTAEEIKMAKQRSYQMIKDVQKSLEKALDGLVYAMSAVGQTAGLPTSGKYDMIFEWDDSIVVDKEQELASMQADVVANIIRPELYIAKKYGVSEEEAIKMMPAQETKQPPDPTLE